MMTVTAIESSLYVDFERSEAGGLGPCPHERTTRAQKYFWTHTIGAADSHDIRF